MKWKWPEAARRWKGALGSYSYVLLVIAVGAALLLLPTGGRDSPGEDTPTQAEGASFDLDAFEAKLERVLSQVEGAGDTRVVLTLDGGSRQVLARNQDRDSGGNNSLSSEKSLIIIPACSNSRWQSISIFPNSIFLNCFTSQKNTSLTKLLNNA